MQPQPDDNYERCRVCNGSGKCQGDFECDACDGEGWVPYELATPDPIGNCPKCNTPVYTREGFCGVCEPHKR